MGNIIRAYEWEKLCSPDLPYSQLLSFLQLQAAQGAFERPPKKPYYFMLARYTADQIQDSKYGKSVNGNPVPRGFMYDPVARRLVPCEALHPWHGPNPDPVPEKPTIEGRKEAFKEKQKANAQKGVIAQLRKRAKELGLNSFGKGRDELARMIAEAEGKMQTTEVAA